MLERPAVPSVRRWGRLPGLHVRGIPGGTMVRTRVAHLVVCTGIILAYFAAPDDWKSSVYLTASISAVIAILIGIRIHRPSSRAPWLFLAVAFSLFIIADATYSVYEVQGEPPFPNLSDIPYLVFYPVLVLALGRFMRLRAQRDRAAWIDASMWTIAAGVLAWEPIIEGYALDTEAGLSARLVALAYPLLDFVLLLMVLRMIAGRLALNPAFLLLSASMLCQTITDVVYAEQVLAGSYVGGLIDLGWLLTYATIGAAALHPSMRALTEPAERRDDVSSRWRLSTLGAAGVVAPALLVYQLITGDITGETFDIVVVASSMAILLLLGVARGSGLVALAERHTGEMTTRQEELQQVMDDRERIIDKLNRKVSHDTLTGLASRDRFVDTLEAELLKGTRPSVAFLDLDDFKTINDTLGHDVGDLLLRNVAIRLRAAIQPEDLIARFGGDEFAVLCAGDVEACARRLLAALEPPVILQGRELRLSVSIGVTTAKVRNSVAGDLLREADVAMYTAKRAGTGWARYQSGMSALLLERMDLRAQLVAALRDGEIIPWFQPVIDLISGRLLGYEALARWSVDGDHVREPDAWLPLAEETGLIVWVDRAVFRSAVTQFAAWRAEYGIADLTLAVNLSGRTLQWRGIAEEMIEVLAELGLPPDRLIVEVTEGVLIEDDLVSARLQILRAAGVKVALDDFGTGWSSLSYLRRFPVDQLKLDQTFTAELLSADGGEAIPAAVLQLASALHLDVVAEGVETQEQRSRLIELGFRTAQGHLFGSAMPALRLAPVLERVGNPAVPTASARLRSLPVHEQVADRVEAVPTAVSLVG